MPSARAIVLRLGIALTVAASCASAQNVSIVKEGEAYKLAGWAGVSKEPSHGWSSVFAVYAGEGDVPPMLGSYTVDHGALIFRPKYTPSPGIRIRAVFRTPGGSPVEARFQESTADMQPSAYVEQVYPSANALPQNLLKFYIQFSAPMSRGEAWSRIHLVDDNGSRVEVPFLEIVQELWDGDNRRLTVLFDPGRIKRGLARRQQMGPALVEGKEFSLVVDREFQDAQGVPMRAEFRKPFRVIPSERTPTEPSQWRLTAPQAHTSGALVVEFTKPMDWAMLQRVFAVEGSGGKNCWNGGRRKPGNRVALRSQRALEARLLPTGH